MPESLGVRRIGLRAAAGILGASAVVAGFALPAGAATAPPANHTIIVSGSNTTYFMMQDLAKLFNESPGCDLAAASGGTQNLNFVCSNPPPTGSKGENGLGDGSGATINGSKQGDPENPYNDVVVNEPPLGSSNGIKQLAQRGTNWSPIDVARSSRAPNNGQPLAVGDPVTTPATDPQGLNFVAYAADAVPWFHWTTVGGKKTPSAGITSLSISQLAGIYNGTITNWLQIPGGKAGPIQVYMAQAGSGTEGTWKQVLGLTSDTPAGVKDGAHVIFENEIQGIISNGDEANAIFYFSYGKFQTNCSVVKKVAQCNGLATPGGKSAFALGSESISGGAIAPTPATIQNGSYPTDRYLFNVYSNGTGVFPVSSQAALNFASEWGFICKQDTAVDSNSGATYATEIKKIITNNGFFPLSSGTIDASNVDSNAAISDPFYSQVDPVPGSPSTASGFCRVFTTDGDSIP